MSQRKLWPHVLIGLLASSYIVLASAQKAEPEFKTVSPFMEQEPASTASTSPASISPMMAPEPSGTANTVASSPALQSSSASPLLNATVNDPYEKINRKIFNFNDSLDTNFLVPVSKLYNKIIPKPLNKGIYNFFSNLNNFPTISNDLLQGNFYQATSDSWRFVVNSTAGAAGLFDVAQNMGLAPNSEDFGLTLARWGYTDSSYIVLPFFGPSTVRDTAGLPVDYYFFSPYNYVGNSRAQYTLYALNIVSKRAQLLQYQNLYNQIALDRYAFIRDAYLQQRASAIDRNQNLSDPYITITSKQALGPSSIS